MGRMKELGNHHAFKTEHGAPHWDQSAEEGWKNRPKTPAHRAELPRPSSARSIRSTCSSMIVPKLKDTKYLGTDQIRVPNYVPRRRRHSVPHGPRGVQGITNSTH